MARMKILMLTRLFPSKAFPAFGTFCLERAKALAVEHDVRVIVPTPFFPEWLPGKDEWKKWTRVENTGIVENDISVVYPRYLSIPGTATWFQGVAMAKSVRKALNTSIPDWRPDVVDGHFAFPDGYAAVRLAQSIGTPAVVTCHGSDLRQYPDIPIAGAMTRWTMRNADRVVSVSTDLMRRSIELGCPKERAVFLNNGVDPSKFTVQEKSACRNKLGLPTERKIGVCVGSLIDVKDQSLLLRSLAEIRKGGHEVPMLVLVGDGPNRLSLIEESISLGLAQDVIFAGQKTHQEVAEWMGAADWLLLSSRSEGWATVYFEAMACGRPVITSNVSSALDAISKADYGQVVEPRDAASFAMAIRQAMRKSYDSSVIRNYAESHTWKKWAQRFGETLKSINGQAT
jgi:glycosyltransferase involved in cell wall biosynthesis